MRAVAIILAFFLASATAFTPMVSPRVTSPIVMSAEGQSRREMLVNTVGASALAFAGVSPALADGAVSQATIQRARGIYGNRIADLETAVKAGNFDAVAAEKNAFILFNSGVYVKPKDKAAKKDAVAKADAVFAAVEKRDKSALQAAYDDFMKTADIQPAYTGKDLAYSQGYSSDYDWKVRTKKGTIYVR